MVYLGQTPMSLTAFVHHDEETCHPAKTVLFICFQFDAFGLFRPSFLNAPFFSSFSCVSVSFTSPTFVYDFRLLWLPLMFWEILWMAMHLTQL